MTATPPERPARSVCLSSSSTSVEDPDVPLLVAASCSGSPLMVGSDPDSQRHAMAVATAGTVAGSVPAFFTGAMAVQLTEALDFGTVGIGAAAASFFGMMALSAPYLGRVTDRLGASLSLRIATITSTVASLWIAIFARNWAMLVAGLMVAGIAAALIQPASNRMLITRVQPGRLGTAFGLKQSAPPTASMLAGISVPAIALTVGWRWAYVLAAVGALAVAIAVGRPSGDRRVRNPRRSRPKLAPLANRPALILLALGLGSSFASSSAILAYYVEGAVRSGVDETSAGLVFAAASMMAICVRLGSGIACDRFRVNPLHLCVALLVAGGGGLGLLATGRPAAMTAGVVLGLAGTWGIPGLYWLAMLRSYPETPGRLTGAMAPAVAGGAVGPLAFGALASDLSYPTAWAAASYLAVFGAAALLLGSRRLTAGQRAPVSH